MRQIYWATARKLNQKKAADAILTADKHRNLNMTSDHSRLEFLWDPYLNSTALLNELMAESHEDPAYPTRLGKRLNAAIVVGGGVWHARHLGDHSINDFKQSMNRIATVIAKPGSNSSIGRNQPPASGKGYKMPILFTPVLTPSYEKLDADRASAIRAEKIQAMNNHLHELEASGRIEVLWTYSLMVYQNPAAYEESGIHVVQDIVTRQADILLNMMCNSISGLQRYPFDRTCCSRPVWPNLVQCLIFIFAASLVSFWFCVSAHSALARGSSGSMASKIVSPQRLSAFCTVCAAAIYCFLADRTLALEKAQKVTDERTFILMSSFIIGMGLLTVTRSKVRVMSNKGTHFQTFSQTFLSRDQTEEWKGWMQFVVLLYHYFGMSKTLWVYQIIRLLVASYLFMTGFGHTIFFYKTIDFSLWRVAMVLVRLNLLSVLLAYVMRTDYDFYYFPALSSFWFLVVYFTLRVRHNPQAKPRTLAAKILLSAIFVRTIVQCPGLLEVFVNVLRMACDMNVNAEELRFRITLDAYIVFVGMLFAILHLQLAVSTPSSLTFPATTIRKWPRTVRFVAISMSLVTLPAFFFLVARFPDKYSYNRWHPAISPFPILAYVILRNALPSLRNCYSRLFAWLGRCSLETFVLQYHIWLAADTKGLLRLGIFGTGRTDGMSKRNDWPWRAEFVVLTSFFLWTSWGVSDATSILTEWIVGPASLEKGEVNGFLQLESDDPDLPMTLVAPLEPNDAGNRFERAWSAACTWLRPRRARTRGTCAHNCQRMSLKTRLAVIVGILWICNWAWR